MALRDVSFDARVNRLSRHKQRAKTARIYSTVRLYTATPCVRIAYRKRKQDLEAL